MRLITQNLLVCNKKTCVGREAPLSLQVMEVTHQPSDFNPEVVRTFIQRLNWPHFRQTVASLGGALPESLGPAELESTEVLQLVHQFLLDVSAT